MHDYLDQIHLLCVGTRSHNEGHVSTPACYLLVWFTRVRLYAEATNKHILLARLINWRCWYAQ